MDPRNAQRLHGAQNLALAGLLLTLALLPFRAYYEVGLLMCWCSAGWALSAGQRPFARPGFRLFLIGLAAYLLAAVWSLPDAYDRSGSTRTALAGLRYLGYGWAACLLTPAHVHRLLVGCGWIVGLWVIDALVQAIFGYSLGGANRTDRVSGIFGDADLKLGPVLGVVAALLLAVLSRARLAWQVLGLLLIVAAVLVAGARAGWVSLGIVVFWWLLRQIRATGRRLWPALTLTAVGSLSLAGVLYVSDAQFAGRMDRTLLLVQGERRAVDTALAFRLPIWETAIRMGREHPVNGVGVRGFRQAYPGYAAQDDRWVRLHAGKSGANHPHQLLLELWSETGIPGLLLWSIAAALLIRAWRHAAAVQRKQAWGPGAALLAMCFPLNTHLAFYSSFWGTLLFWLLALYCVSLQQDQGAQRPTERAADGEATKRPIPS